jgi:hypothetical protein
MNMRNTNAMIEDRGEEEATPDEGTPKQQKSARLAEECLWISVGMFRVRRKGQWRASGVLTWAGERSGRVTGVARYRIHGCSGAEPGQKSPLNSTGGPVLLLAGAGRAHCINFRSSAVTYGRRWYFVCACGRSCGKLFLPPGEQRWACRRCQGLRYWSQRHESDWFYRPLAGSTGIKKRLLRQYFYAIGQAALRSEAFWAELFPEVGTTG